MRIAVASGKGGTGKTTVSTSLALALAKEWSVSLLDCDVEEPNAHLFIGDKCEGRDAMVSSFAFDQEKCIRCGKCAKACRFNSIAVLASGPMFFPEMCHSCGGCVLACPVGAVSETNRVNGKLYTVNKGNLQLVYGLLNVGEAMAVSLIRSVKNGADAENEICIIDSPPGAACAMLSAVSECDYVVMVTEPTPFGLHDLKLAIEALKESNLRYGVVVNRAEEGVNLIRDFCRESGTRLLLEIPQSRTVAEGYSRGIPLIESYPQAEKMMQDLYRDILQEVNND